MPPEITSGHETCELRGQFVKFVTSPLGMGTNQLFMNQPESSQTFVLELVHANP